MLLDKKLHSENNKDSLFQLIKSLSKSEKRYFKLQSALNTEESNYMKLFDCIDKMAKWNMNTINKEFKDHKMLNNFHVSKKYLFDNIMKSLMDYHSNLSVKYEIRTKLNQIEILTEKGLHDISYTLLKQIEKKALENEQFLFLPEIILMRKLNLLYRNQKGYSSKDLSEFESKKKHAIQNIENQMLYLGKLVQLFDEYVKWVGIKKPEINSIFSELDTFNETFKDENAHSIYAKILLFNLKGYYHHENARYEESQSYRLKIITLLNNHPKFKKEYLTNFIIAKFNLIQDLRMLGKFNEVEKLIVDFKNIQTQTFNQEAEKFKRYFIVTTQLIADTGNFQSIDYIQKDFTKKIHLYKSSVSDSTIRIIYSNFAHAYFSNQQYSEALDLYNKIINKPKKEIDIGLNTMCRIWVLISHYELGNYSILPYLTKSTKQFFLRNKVLTPIDQTLFSFFSSEHKFLSTNRKKTLKAIRNKISSELTPILDKNMNYNRLLCWLDSKINDISFKKSLKNNISKVSN